MSKREAAEAAFEVPPAKRLYRDGPDDLCTALCYS
jgi:hypothetical protein